MVRETLPEFRARLEGMLSEKVNASSQGFYSCFIEYGYVISSIASANVEKRSHLKNRLASMRNVFGDGELYSCLFSVLAIEGQVGRSDPLKELSEICGYLTPSVDELKGVFSSLKFEELEMTKGLEVPDYSVRLNAMAEVNAFLAFSSEVPGFVFPHVEVKTEFDLWEVVTRFSLLGYPAVIKRIVKENTDDFEVVETASALLMNQ